jgi:hypothetical protein
MSKSEHNFKIQYNKTKLPKLDVLEKQYEPTNSQEIDIQYNPFKIQNLQNYNPIYSLFFEMNENNYNKISLNQANQFVDMNTILKGDSPLENPVFIKFAPLLDPIRYMIGKYNLSDPKLLEMPKPDSNSEPIHENGSGPRPIQNKLQSANNASYVDCFFSYLSSQLLNHHQIVNAVDFYGSYVGVQNVYKMNITDDLEYLNTSTFFLENVGKLFSITADTAEYVGAGSRTNKQKLLFLEDSEENILDAIELDNDVSPVDEKPIAIEESAATIVTDELVYEKENRLSKSTTGSSSTNSSNNSETNYSSNDECDSDDENESDENESDENDSDYTDCSDSDNESDDDDSELFAYINNFPVQMICLEKCNGTLDDLFEKDIFDEASGSAALFQIVMTLIAYQKAFEFTHNDLHTNNIMYSNTDIEYLYYRFSEKTYRVPTYGKIFKIIDFGRSIYKVNGKTFCSDSFAPGGDAATQYNCEPFFTESKPRIDPNFSFDLCRLGCSIYDFIIDVDDKSQKLDDFQKTIARWCSDDMGKNVLYKKTGEERYPNFKLYKMISRTVHKHTPQAQLDHKMFSQYEKSDISAADNVIDIDAIPSYV